VKTLPEDYQWQKKVSHKPQILPQRFVKGFLANIDRRTDLARTLRKNYDQIVKDLGGKAEVGFIRNALIERFVWLDAIP
jgi:hypothetical protein